MDGISNYMDYFRISKQFAAMHFTTPECHSFNEKIFIPGSINNNL